MASTTRKPGWMYNRRMNKFVLSSGLVADWSRPPLTPSLCPCNPVFFPGILRLSERAKACSTSIGALNASCYRRFEQLRRGPRMRK